MPKISLFKNISKVYEPENIDLELYLEYNRDGKWEDIVNECRTISDKEKRDEFKRSMPTATLSGTFSHRGDADLVDHSEYIAMDLDDVENLNILKRKLEDDKYVYSVFMSTGGRGLRVLFRIDKNKHRESFIGISSYLLTEYGVAADSNSSLSKPYCVSFDPYLYINPNLTKLFKSYVKEVPIKYIPDLVYTPGDFQAILAQISGRGVVICPSYNEWIKVGFGLAEQFGEDGRGYFHEISRHHSKYKKRETDLQFTSCMKAKGSSKANIATFYYLAKTHGINICSEQTKTIIRSTKSGKRAGLKKDQIAANLKKFSNIENADKVIDKIFDSEDTNEQEEEQSILPEIEMFISNNYSLKMNEVTGYFEQNGRPLSAADLNSLFVAAKKIIPKLDYPLMMRLLKSDFIETYNPFFKFFESDGIAVELPALPEKTDTTIWSSPLIEKMASTIKNSNPAYTLFFLRKWLVSVVSAAHKVHSPLLLCLIGPPGCGKTEYFRRLLPFELRQYYTQSKLDKGKDDEILMTETLIIMDDEMSGKNKSDTQKLKNLTSTDYFSLRRPYGEHNEKIQRLAVLCATSNYKEVIVDSAVNRRIIPIDVDDIDKELYNSINKNDLWKEIYSLYKQGFDWRVTHFDMPYLNVNIEEYETVSAEKELILKYFAPIDEIRLSLTEIKVEIEIITKQKLNVLGLGRELKKAGFDLKSTREGQSTSKKWCVKRKNRRDNYSAIPEEENPF